ncbi:hypothetical protein ABTE09_19325, partial [Acinetobacter baumannii]
GLQAGASDLRLQGMGKTADGREHVASFRSRSDADTLPGSPPAVIPPQEKTSNLLTTCAKNAMFRPRCTRTAQSEQFATARQYNQEIAA